ncbi:MAG: serine hydrolase domain-containing protein [Acidimicrobiales bacterium]
MTKLIQDVAPADVGFDADRLDRIDRHFDRYVADGRLPNYLVAVARGGQVCHIGSGGYADIEDTTPVDHDTIFRIFSMTKPITSAAALMLWEEGAFELKDPVSSFIPSFADARVYRSGSAASPLTEPASEPMRMWHLFTHTAGLTYGFHHVHPVDAMYRAAGWEWGTPKGLDLAGACESWAALPLVNQPGTAFNYSVATDVLGRVVEVLSGQTLDAFFDQRILQPLGMDDTRFFVPDDQRHRLASLYVPTGPGRTARRMHRTEDVASSTPAYLSGGGGLMSTAGDYLRFANVLRCEGEVDGVRLLSSRTVRYLRQNHLPGGVDLDQFGNKTFAETSLDGVGFGLGVSVVIDPVKNKVPGSVGEFGWGGAASTAFFVDPVEDLTTVFLTQLLPSSTWPIRSQLKQLLHPALID